jgi:hypothetical protein
MQDLIPMSIKFPEETHAWIKDSAKKLEISIHRFVVAYFGESREEMSKPEGEEQMPKILLKLRAAIKIEEAPRRSWKPQEPVPIPLEKKTGTLLPQTARLTQRTQKKGKGRGSSQSERHLQREK